MVLDNVQAGQPDGKCNRKIPPIDSLSLAQDKPRPERATASRRVRVKWCGKSAPRLQRWRWHGKPHRQQDRTAESAGPARYDPRVGRSSRSAMTGPEKWSLALSERSASKRGRSAKALRPASLAPGEQNSAYKPPRQQTIGGDP